MLRLTLWVSMMLPGLAWAGDLVMLEGAGGDEFAWAINEAGIIAGTSFSSDGSAVPVRWTNESVDVLDGPIALPDGSLCSLDWGDARNVTNSGDVVARVWSWCGGLDVYRAATWDDDSRTWEPLPMPPGTTFTWNPIANSAGFVVSSSDVGWTLYNPDGTMAPAGVPAECQVYAMNNQRRSVGFCGDDPATWYRGEQTILPSTDGVYAYARGLNDNGSIVGVLGYSLSDNSAAAVLWSRGELTVVDPLGWATNINNRGDVVGALGENGSDENPLTPVWWDKHGDGPVELTPGDVGVARAINDSGTIVGHIFVEGSGDEAFMYYP